MVEPVRDRVRSRGGSMEAVWRLRRAGTQEGAVKGSCSLILHFTDPAIANKCIDRHVAFGSRLLPTVKYIRHPPQCYNCQQMGHIARHCKSKMICGLCAEYHDTRQCRNTQKDIPLNQFALFKCAVCQGPHAVSDKGCPARRAAIHSHWCGVADTGPLFPA